MHHGDSDEEVTFSPEEDDYEVTDEEDNNGEMEEGACGADQLTIWMNMSEDDFQMEVENAMANDNEALLMQLVEVQERRCKKLKETWKEEQNKEEIAKRKRMQALADRFKKLQKTESGLSRSIASSRNNTPVNSPNKKSGVKKTISKSPRRSVNKGKPATKVVPKSNERMKLDAADPQEVRGKQIQANNLLTSILELKQGKTEAFSELVAQAMQATNNLSIIDVPKRVKNKESRLDEKEFRNSKFKPETVENETMGGCMSAEALYNSQRNQQQHHSVVNTIEGQKQLIQLLKEVKQARGGNEQYDQLISDIKASIGNKDTLELKIEDKSKKLTSGRIAKPDEVDIKKPVKYPHEKLDPTFFKKRVFDKLSFPMLVAGEMELILLKEVTQEEKIARVAMMRTLAYHKSYLEDEDLRTGYAAILKKVEQDTREWDLSLAEELHRFYELRGQALLREQIQKKEAGSTADSQSNYNYGKTDNNNEENETSNETKIIYCMEFNKGTCNMEKAHTGKWKGKKCTKWHVCKTCIKFQELNNHPEGDPSCPHNN